jgi:hypothetical protein
MSQKKISANDLLSSFVTLCRHPEEGDDEDSVVLRSTDGGKIVINEETVYEDDFARGLAESLVTIQNRIFSAMSKVDWNEFFADQEAD